MRELGIRRHVHAGAGRAVERRRSRDVGQAELAQPVAGRRDEIGGKSGVYPFSEAPQDLDAPVRTGAEFGQGDRGPEGYDDAGTLTELIRRNPM